MILIGISGKKGSGKDTTADAIKTIAMDYGIPVYTIAFADPLKEEIYQNILKPNGVSKKALYDGRKIYFRLIMQGYGTDFKRNLISKTYWTDLFKNKIEAYKNKLCIVIATDVRFPEEYGVILEEQGRLIRVVRKKSLLSKIKSYFSRDNHSSECALDQYNFHYTVKNTGTVEDLRAKLEPIVLDLLIENNI